VPSTIGSNNRELEGSNAGVAAERDAKSGWDKHMHRFRFLLAAAFAVLLSACAAGDGQAPAFTATRSGDAAATVRLLHLNPPTDYCALDRSQPVDALSLALLEKTVDGIAQILAVWRPCPDLLASRRGIRNFDRPTAAITAVVQHGAAARAPMPRASLLPLVAALFGSRDKARDAAIDDEVRRRFDETIGRLAESFGSHAALGDMTHLGVRAQDRNAVYLAALSDATVGDQQITLDNIVAVTEINGLIIEVAVFANRTDDPEMKHLLAFAQSLMAKLIADNDHPNQTDV
jgi:hypothetical protein